MKQELLRIRYEETAAQARPQGGGQDRGRAARAEAVARGHHARTPTSPAARTSRPSSPPTCGQVHRGEAATSTSDPAEFFRRTYLTEGLRELLVGAVRAARRQGRRPGRRAADQLRRRQDPLDARALPPSRRAEPASLPGVEASCSRRPASTQLPQGAARRAGRHGALAGQSPRSHDGTRGPHAVGRAGLAARRRGGYDARRRRRRTRHQAPASTPARAVQRSTAPCLVLIDEWVAYARQLYGDERPARRVFDANFTFAQALTEAAKRAPGARCWSPACPASEIEIGGEGGETALERLKNVFGRVESPWRPASAEEGFEIVRRRLFEPIDRPRDVRRARRGGHSLRARCTASSRASSPPECREAEYERRMKAAYPIHPELFDRLYNDWSTLDRFQRTRGVLRLMAAVIHALWERDDPAC